jgi:hypothetical protein
MNARPVSRWRGRRPAWPWLLLALLVARPVSASAFSLLGPYAPWMTEALGYRSHDAIGGPVPLGSEYRWNQPVITYGFDRSFMDYFGQRGVAEVEKAIRVFNELPPASQMALDAFPADVFRGNFAAAELGLLDLKSATLRVLLAQLGLGPSEQNLWTVGPKGSDDIVQFNYDPESLWATTEVNGILYTRVVRAFAAGEKDFLPVAHLDAIEIAVQVPNTLAFSSVAGRPMSAGQFHSDGLTRDDAGGLRYLLSATNVNLEALPAGTTGPEGSLAGMVDVAPRPGVEKIRLVRVPADPLLETGAPLTNRWTDTYLSDGRAREQVVQRVATRPDIVFTAADLGTVGLSPVTVFHTGTTNWVNHALLNGNAGGEGPGVIQPGVVIAFAKLGRPRINQAPFFLDQDHLLTATPVWGAFDGTTNAPVAFPQGALAPLNLLSTARLEVSSGSRHFVWSAGQRDRRLASTNLVDWVPVALLTNATGLVEVSALVGEGSRFYRVVAD